MVVRLLLKTLVTLVTPREEGRQRQLCAFPVFFGTNFLLRASSLASSTNSNLVAVEGTPFRLSDSESLGHFAVGSSCWRDVSSGPALDFETESLPQSNCLALALACELRLTDVYVQCAG